MATNDNKIQISKNIPMLKQTVCVRDLSGKLVKVVPNFKEDVVFETSICDFTPGESLRNLRIVNKLNLFNHTSKTVATYVSTAGSVRERTSDEVVRLIGQANYDTVFSALCSVINQELKVRGILSLLTVPKQSSSTSCQVPSTQIKVEDIPTSNNTTVRRRRKRQSAPYVVKDEPKKVVISPNDFKRIYDDKDKQENSLPDLKGQIQLDENSNDSIHSNFSICTTNELLMDPVSLINNVDKHTQEIIERSRDSLEVCKRDNVRVEPAMCKVEDQINLASKDRLSNMSIEERNRMKLLQAAMDYKCCLVEDEDGNYPIHVAVLNNDMDLLRRQCLMLKMRNATVDISGCRGAITALKMALYQENANITAMLLHYGADPLAPDEEFNTAFHLAAERGGGHLKAIVSYCKKNIRRLLQEEEKLWQAEYENREDAQLESIFFSHVCSTYNNQGYSPLMLASRLGHFEAVQLLLELVPGAAHANAAMPNSGETALYVAVAAAIMCSIENGDKSKVADRFRRTLTALLRHGADPGAANFSNACVHDLVQEAGCSELNNIIGNANTAIISGDALPRDCGALMLLKEKNRPIQVKEFKKQARKPPADTRKGTRKAPAAKTGSSAPNSPVTSSSTRNATVINTSNSTPNSPVTIINNSTRNAPIINTSCSTSPVTNINNISRNAPVINTSNGTPNSPVTVTSTRNSPIINTGNLTRDASVIYMSKRPRSMPVIIANGNNMSNALVIDTSKRTRYDNNISAPGTSTKKKDIKILDSKILTADNAKQIVDVMKTGVGVKRKAALRTVRPVKRANTND